VSFDTRHKIITLDQARALAGDPAVQRPIAFVTHLEVLRAPHIHRLEAVAATNSGKLFVILTDPEAPLVPMEDRAELAAALEAVDYVVPSPDGAGQALAAIDASLVVDDEEEDRGRTRWLIEHVRSRSPL
jgi:hypothetical protein